MNLTLLVSAAAVIEEGTLLISQRKNGLWELPGGKVETGEDPRRTVERELREELALSVEAGPVFEVIHYDYPRFSVTMLVFLCRLKGPFEPELLDGPVDVRRERLDRLRAGEFMPADRDFIRRLSDRPEAAEQRARLLWAGEEER